MEVMELSREMLENCMNGSERNTEHVYYEGLKFCKSNYISYLTLQ